MKFYSNKNNTNERTSDSIKQEILQSLKNKPKGFYELSESLKINDQDLSNYLLELFDEEKISSKKTNLDWYSFRQFPGEKITRKYKEIITGETSTKVIVTEIKNMNIIKRTKLFDVETRIYFTKAG